LQLHSRLRHTPVIFVHGNQADAQNWLDVMEQFQNNAHYTMQEMYALSYNGLGNYYAGTPTRTPPSSLDQAYLQQNPTALANGGHGAADDDEVPDLCRFVEAVQWYTGSRKVDLVGHSLGVTIIRKFMFDYPSLAKDVVAVVGIAGANHGTTVCRGLETSYYGCNEIAPGTPWLAQLNGPGGSRETYAPTTWMTVYNGLEGDPFFVGPDAPSPQLRGADNRTFAGEYHNDLRVGAAEVDTYLAFLLRHGQAGPGAAGDGDAVATDIETTPHDGHSAQLVGIPLLTS
jgi:pimeloyl-ACP methyl ester carboxylesterase